MPIIHDDEFGKIVVRRSPRATQVRLRVAPDGSLRASLPMYAPLFLVKRLLKSSRGQFKQLQRDSSEHESYTDGMQVGKSHTLLIRSGTTLRAVRKGQRIHITIPDDVSRDDPQVASVVRPVVIQALRVEAKSYLPKRLAYLAVQYGYQYERVRFSHASGRWGSCSSQGTVSLNIALMKLPFELIDYVLIHELAHTKEMNHSSEFWRLVSMGDPDYAEHRRQIKQQTPSI